VPKFITAPHSLKRRRRDSLAFKAGSLVHWNYFLAIERDVEVLSRYVEFDESNFDCFSIEIARILLAAGAEVDVVCKQLCRMTESDSNAGNIRQYRGKLINAIAGIANFEVTIARFGLTLKPWDEWRNDPGVPFWWTAYNKVKHQRDSHYDRANLKNALNSVAGLFVLVLYFYQSFALWGGLSPSAQLFGVTGVHDLGIDPTNGNHRYQIEAIQEVKAQCNGDSAQT